MNELIKELAERASEYAWNNNPDEDSYGRPANPGKFQQDRDTKFAELIVRECADISDTSFHNGSAGYTAILKHFGVEE